ncbi:I78 family peptidase inhibitor [Elioraea sp.]|uniref:I78 family peptidase inhibitor n=1 Tax=Elioraea sp. TaxID=2185103 RepID=UPI0025B92909|nr:I78 family peptidase inhibitor [Elioraea sp.]
MMLPRPDECFCPTPTPLRPVRWNRLAASLVVLLAIMLLMMWLAPSARGSEAACAAAAEAVLRDHGGRVLPEGWRADGVRTVRVLGPRDAATMDHDPARLTVLIDDARRVTGARCG